MSQPTPVIGLGVTNLTFSTPQGTSNTLTQTVSLQNSAGGSMQWVADTNQPWLAAGQAGCMMNVSVFPGNLSAGTYSGTITVSSTEATNSPQPVPVTLTVTDAGTPPSIGLSPTSLSFSATENGANPAAQTITVSNTGGGTLSWSVSDNAAWLTASKSSSTITAGVSISGLAAGTYNGTITVTDPNASNSPQTVPVSLTVSAAPVPPAIGLSPTSLSFSATEGGSNPASQSVTVSNTGGGTLSWSVSDDAAWLSTSKSGSSITASVAISGVAAGSYNGTITVTDSNASNSPQTVSVALTVASAPPTIGLSPTSLSFSATEGGVNPAGQTITVSNTGGGTLSWSVADNAAWLSTATSGSTITASVDVSGLTAGTYSGTITVSDPNATNNPQTVSVSLTVDATLPVATLTWDPNSESDLAGYKIYRSTTPGSYGAAIATVPAGTITYEDTTLSSNTTYYWVISAYDTSDNESDFSNEVSKSIF